MNRPTFVVLVALAAALSAGCASTARSPTQSLASDIVYGSSSNPNCASDEAPRCMTIGTRIHSLNPQRTCECLMRELVLHAR